MEARKTYSPNYQKSKEEYLKINVKPENLNEGKRLLRIMEGFLSEKEIIEALNKTT